MAIYFGWPVLCALTIAGVVAFTTSGLKWLDGMPLDEAATVGAKWFLLLLPFQVIAYLFFAAWAWGGPVRLAKLSRPPVPRAPRPREPRALAVNSKRSRRVETLGEKMQRAFARIGKEMNQAGKGLASAPPPRQRVLAKRGSFAQDARPVQASVIRSTPREPEEWAMYRLVSVTHTMYGGDCTRDGFQAAYPGENGQEMHRAYRDMWERLGWVELDGRGAIKQWNYPEWELYADDRKMRQIAAQLGVTGPDRRTQ